MATTTEKKRGHFSRKNRQVIEFEAVPYGKKGRNPIWCTFATNTFASAALTEKSQIEIHDVKYFFKSLYQSRPILVGKYLAVGGKCKRHV